MEMNTHAKMKKRERERKRESERGRAGVSSFLAGFGPNGRISDTLIKLEIPRNCHNHKVLPSLGTKR